MTFLESFWLVVEIFFFFAYIVVMLQIIGDLFRDTTVGGGVRAGWVFFLIVLPVLTALVDLIARGTSMTERQVQAVTAAQEGTKVYIREVAGTSPAQEIAAARRCSTPARSPLPSSPPSSPRRSPRTEDDPLKRRRRAWPAPCRPRAAP